MVEFDSRFRTLCKFDHVPSVDDIRSEPTHWNAALDDVCGLDGISGSAARFVRDELVGRRDCLRGFVPRYSYLDSKVQFFRRGQYPMHDIEWHMDAPLLRAHLSLDGQGGLLLYDTATSLSNIRFISIIFGGCSRTELVLGRVRAPRMEQCRIDQFDELINVAVQKRMLRTASHPVGRFVLYDNAMIHRARAATNDGWRLWMRFAFCEVPMVYAQTTRDRNAVFDIEFVDA
jgi:hypothetical protein